MKSQDKTIALIKAGKIGNSYRASDKTKREWVPYCLFT